MEDNRTLDQGYDSKGSTKSGYEARVAYRDRSIAAQYDRRRFGSLRGWLGNWLDRRAIRAALGYIPRDGGLILDVPCGTGRVTYWLSEAGYGVIGADVAAEMIAIARDHLTGLPASSVGYVLADAAHLPFRKNAFSCVTAIRFLGHIPPEARVQMLREFARVGQDYIIADYCASFSVTRLWRWIQNRLRRGRLGFSQSWTWQSVSKRDLVREFRSAGLQPVRWFAKLRFLSDGWTVLLASEDKGDETGIDLDR